MLTIKKMDKKSLAVAFGTVIFMSILTLIISLFVNGSRKDNAISIEDISISIEEKVELSNMKIGNNKDLKHFYGLNNEDFEDVLIYVPKTSMNVEELLIIKVKNLSQIDSVEEAIENRVENQLNNFDGYGVDQCELLDNYEIKIMGNYIFYSVGKNALDIKSAFKSSIQ